MTAHFQFKHTNGYRAQRFRCPLLFPKKTGQSCPHEQFLKGRGCVKDVNWERGGQMRVTLDRDGPLYHAVYNQRTSEFEFRAGPIVAHVVLADEINRATPKTQSALLEAMEEQQVTLEGETRPLPRPLRRTPNDASQGRP